MKYVVKSAILGFDELKEVELSEENDLFTELKGSNEEISFTLVNPYALREYSFDVPPSVQTLLGINETSNLKVYNIVVRQEPVEESKVNFLAPLIFNDDNATMAQIVLPSEQNPDFGLAEPIKSFK